MTRHRFGGVADYVVSLGDGNAAVLTPGITVTCWSAAVGGVQYTDLTDIDGTTPIPDGELTSDEQGAVPEFYGPDGIRVLYLDANDGAGPRRRTVATDIGEDLTTAEQTLANLSEAALTTDAVTAAGDLLVGIGPGAMGRVGIGGAGQTLVADPLQVTGMRWSSAWRRRDLPDPLLADGLYEGPAPTISTAQQSTPTIPGAITIAPTSDQLLYLGAGDFQFGEVFPDTNYYLPTSRYPNTYSSGQASWSVAFCTDAEEFEIGFKHISAATMYRLTIDGRKVTDLMQSAGGITPGSAHMLKVSLGSAAPRHIRVDLTTMPFRGVYVPPTATVWRPNSVGGRMAVLGDSISDGSNQNVGFGHGTWVRRAARLLGCDDVWNQSRGGTGYITSGSYTTFGNRVEGDIVPYGFDRVVVWGGYNDNIGDQGAIGAAAASLYGALKDAVVPGGEVYVIGCWSPSGSPASTITATDNTLKSAAAAAQLPFISPVSGEVYDGSGALVAAQGPWITSANASTYIGADNVHPNDPGHQYLAHRIVEALKALMPA